MKGFITIEGLEEILNGRRDFTRDMETRGIISKNEAYFILDTLDSIQTEARWARTVFFDSETKKLKDLLGGITINKDETL
jgi:hypothetical protein